MVMSPREGNIPFLSFSSTKTPIQVLPSRSSLLTAAADATKRHAAKEPNHAWITKAQGAGLSSHRLGRLYIRRVTGAGCAKASAFNSEIVTLGSSTFGILTNQGGMKSSKSTLIIGV